MLKVTILFRQLQFISNLLTMRILAYVWRSLEVTFLPQINSKTLKYINDNPFLSSISASSICMYLSFLLKSVARSNSASSLQLFIISSTWTKSGKSLKVGILLTKFLIIFPWTASEISYTFGDYLHTGEVLPNFICLFDVEPLKRCERHNFPWKTKHLKTGFLLMTQHLYNNWTRGLSMRFGKTHWVLILIVSTCWSLNWRRIRFIGADYRVLFSFPDIVWVHAALRLIVT